MALKFSGTLEDDPFYSTAKKKENLDFKAASIHDQDQHQNRSNGSLIEKGEEESSSFVV